MDNQSLMKCLDESVAQFNILAEGDLISIAMRFINQLRTQDTVPTLISFRSYLKEYDEATKHLHKDNVDELVFKIDTYLDEHLESKEDCLRMASGL